MEKEAETQMREAAFPGSYIEQDVQSKALIPNSGFQKGLSWAVVSSSLVEVCKERLSSSARG